MRTIKLIALTISIGMLAVSTGFAQPGRGGPPGGGPPGGGRGGPPQSNPVAEAIDANGDHEISKEEIENAPDALRALDRNGDGKLSADDIRGGQQDSQRRGGQRTRPESQNRTRSNDQRSSPVMPSFVERIREFDSNQDGVVSKDELPERMVAILDRHDVNQDGSLDAKELESISAQTPETSGRSGSRGSSRSGGSRNGAREQQSSERGRRSGPRGSNEESGPRGRPDSNQMVEHAMTFDSDKDGKLSRDELARFAEALGSHGPNSSSGPGGRSGRNGSQNRDERGRGQGRRPQLDGGF